MAAETPAAAPRSSSMPETLPDPAGPSLSLFRPAGLDMQLAEGGAPLSAGQKQLVAMARALLRRSKVSYGVS